MRARRWTTALLLSLGSASAASWADLGQSLAQACQVGTGGAAKTLWSGSDSLQWVCQLRNLHGFITDQLVNGDWEAFATDVIGRYATSLSAYAGKGLGMDALNASTERLNALLRSDYATFRRGLFGELAAALHDRSDDNAGLPDTSAGGLADAAVRANPTLNAAQTAGRLAGVADAHAQLLKAYRAKKLAEENARAIEQNVAPAVETASNVIGTPVQPGTADGFVQEADTALSAREVQTVQLKAFAAFMKQSAVMDTAILNQLSEISKQGVMTNTQLLERQGELQAAQQGGVNALKAQVEQLAQDNLDAAVSAGRAFTRAYANAHGVLAGPDDIDLTEVAP